MSSSNPVALTKAAKAALCLGALGVVFGDIGTSPLYTMRECIARLPTGVDRAEGILGILSLISWALFLVVSVKYLFFVTKADNRGEGGIFALLITGIPLSVSAAIGFIALFGQAVLNGVVMVAYFNQLRDAGAWPEEAVMRGSLTRMRTVLMTGLLAALGLLPMAVSTGIGSETQKPLAVVVIGGLVTATLLTLIVLPALYLVFERLSKPGWRRPAWGR